MLTATILHNPHCSKSRQALTFLQQHPYNIIVRDYIHQPLSLLELQQWQQALQLRPKCWLRQKEAIFEQLNVDVEHDSDVLQVMTQHPQLIERPLIQIAERAVVGRPLDNLKQLIAATDATL